MRVWNTKRHYCLDLTETEQMSRKRRITPRNILEWIQDQLVRRGVLLTEPEQALGYSEHLHYTWRGSPVSQAAMPYMTQKRVCFQYEEIEHLQPIQPRLKTTSAYWPLEYKSYADVSQEAS